VSFYDQFEEIVPVDFEFNNGDCNPPRDRCKSTAAAVLRAKSA
jgi:hypothetical protein